MEWKGNGDTLRTRYRYAAVAAEVELRALVPDRVVEGCRVVRMDAGQGAQKWCWSYGTSERERTMNEGAGAAVGRKRVPKKKRFTAKDTRARTRRGVGERQTI